VQCIAIYTRISADPKGEEAGVERQLKGCKQLAKKLGGRIVATFSDNDASAYSAKTRPDFEVLLSAIANREFQVLVVWHVDRLYRSMRDLERIIEAAEAGGVTIRTVNSGDLDLSTSAGRMVARILGSVARQESEHHAERRRLANRERAISGHWRKEGSRPFGYTKDGTPLGPEAGMLRRAAKDVLGGKSLHSIAREWNESGVTTVRGVRWTNLHIRRVLTNPRIAGLRVHQGEVVGTGLWEPIVEETTWRGLCAFLSDRSRKNTVAFERRYMGSGTYQCGVPGCGRRLYASHPHGRDRSMIYTCRPTGHLGRNGAALDDYVERIVIGYLERNGVGQDLRNAENNVDIDALRTERDALAAQKDQLATLLRKQVLTVAGVERESAVLTAQIDEIDRKLAATVGTHPVVALLTDGDEEIDPEDIEKLIEKWKAASPDRSGKVINALFDVIVNPARPGQRTFDPDLIDIVWKQNRR
jgi:site-specific DNA recombinase